MCAFDIIGKNHLDGEVCFVNHEDDLESLKDTYCLTWYELMGYILASRNDSCLKCLCLCDVGISYFMAMTDAMLYLHSSKEKVIKNVLHCFNEIF